MLRRHNLFSFNDVVKKWDWEINNHPKFGGSKQKSRGRRAERRQATRENIQKYGKKGSIKESPPGDENENVFENDNNDNRYRNGNNDGKRVENFNHEFPPLTEVRNVFDFGKFGPLINMENRELAKNEMLKSFEESLVYLQVPTERINMYLSEFEKDYFTEDVATETIEKAMDQIYEKERRAYITEYLEQQVEPLLYDLELNERARDDILQDIYNYGSTHTLSDMMKYAEDYYDHENERYEQYLDKVSKYENYMPLGTRKANIDNFVRNLHDGLNWYNIPDGNKELFQIEFDKLYEYDKDHSADEVMDFIAPVLQDLNEHYEKLRIEDIYNTGNLNYDPKNIHSNMISNAMNYHKEVVKRNFRPGNKQTKTNKRAFKKYQKLQNKKKLREVATRERRAKRAANKSRVKNIRIRHEKNQNIRNKEEGRILLNINKRRRTEEIKAREKNKELEENLRDNIAAATINLVGRNTLLQPQVIEPNISPNARSTKKTTKTKKTKKNYMVDKSQAILQHLSQKAHMASQKALKEKYDPYVLGPHLDIIPNVNMGTYIKKGYSKNQINKIRKVLDKREEDIRREKELLQHDLGLVYADIEHEKNNTNENINENMDNRLNFFMEQLAPKHIKISELGQDIKDQIAFIAQELNIPFHEAEGLLEDYNDGSLANGGEMIREMNALKERYMNDRYNDAVVAYKNELRDKLRQYDNNLVWANNYDLDEEISKIQRKYETELEQQSKRKKQDVNKILEYRDLMSSIQSQGSQVLDQLQLAGPKRVDEMVKILVPDDPKGKRNVISANTIDFKKAQELYSTKKKVLENERAKYRGWINMLKRMDPVSPKVAKDYEKSINNYEKLIDNIGDKLYNIRVRESIIDEAQKINKEENNLLLTELSGNLTPEIEEKRRVLEDRLKELREKMAMYQEADNYNISVTDENINRYPEYKKAKQEFNAFHEKYNALNIINSNKLEAEQNKMSSALNKIENTILKNKLSRRKKSKKRNINAERNKLKRKIQEGEKLLAERLKKRIIKRKQDERNKMVVKPNVELENREPTNKLLEKLQKELVSIKKKWERREKAASEGNKKAIRGLPAARKKFKSDIKEKTMNVIERMRELGQERNAQLLENMNFT